MARRVTVKTLKNLLKKNGLKTAGTKATLTRRAKKARLVVDRVSTTVKKAADTAKSVLGVGEAMVQAPLKIMNKALKSSKGGRR